MKRLLYLLLPFCFCFLQDAAEAQNASSSIELFFSGFSGDVEYSGENFLATQSTSSSGLGSSSVSFTPASGPVFLSALDSFTLQNQSNASVALVGPTIDGFGTASVDTSYALEVFNPGATEALFGFTVVGNGVVDSSSLGILPLSDASANVQVSFSRDEVDFLNDGTLSSSATLPGLRSFSVIESIEGTLLAGETTTFLFNTSTVANSFEVNGSNPTVPEPSSATLLLALGVGQLLRRKRA